MSSTEWLAMFGTQPAGTDHDLLTLAKRVQAGTTKPQILIDCGVDDFLIDSNRSLEAELNKIGLEHIYREFPGAHDWNYWDLHIREALQFHAEAMKLEPIA